MIDDITPEDLARPRQRLTAAERVSKYRRVHGHRQISLDLTPDAAACLLYIKKQWGMKSNREAVHAALRFLAVCTRSGLQILPQTMDD